VKPGGFVIISVPNVRNWRVLYDLLLKGRWDYTGSGILDVGHLRLFTKKTIFQALNEIGLDIVRLKYRPTKNG